MNPDDFSVGDDVRYIPGHRGYYSAVVVGYAGTRLVIEFYSGLRISAWPDELERM
ncbi:MAG: hypothetical protein FWG59_03360 [Betaproteobacteria bacterium]|nr:hypothetical protein [Betaproteobacteria bacterium]